MNTIELVHALRNNATTKKFFKGVFPCDHLPRIIRKPACVIANTDPANKRGTHWVAFYFPSKGPAEYFDSFGNYPSNKFFRRFLHANSKLFVNNKKRLQSAFSSTCGHYCSVFLYSRCKGKSLKRFLRRFSLKEFGENDDKIINLYQQLFLMGSSQSGGVYCNQNCKAQVESIKAGV